MLPIMTLTHSHFPPTTADLEIPPPGPCLEIGQLVGWGGGGGLVYAHSVVCDNKSVVSPPVFASKSLSSIHAKNRRLGDDVTGRSGSNFLVFATSLTEDRLAG